MSPLMCVLSSVFIPPVLDEYNTALSLFSERLLNCLLLGRGTTAPEGGKMTEERGESRKRGQVADSL